MFVILFLFIDLHHLFDFSIPRFIYLFTSVTWLLFTVRDPPYSLVHLLNLSW